MTKLIVILSVLMVAGCGKPGMGNSSPTPASGALWASADQAVFNAGCVSSALGSSASPTNAQAVTYCQCVLNAVMSKYSATEFNANAAADSSAIASDGTTLSSCRSQAGL